MEEDERLTGAREWESTGPRGEDGRALGRAANGPGMRSGLRKREGRGAGQAGERVGLGFGFGFLFLFLLLFFFWLLNFTQTY